MSADRALAGRFLASSSRSTTQNSAANPDGKSGPEAVHAIVIDLCGVAFAMVPPATAATMQAVPKIDLIIEKATQTVIAFIPLQAG